MDQKVEATLEQLEALMSSGEAADLERIRILTEEASLEIKASIARASAIINGQIGGPAAEVEGSATMDQAAIDSLFD